MEKIRVLYRLVVTVTCLVCLGFSGGKCSELDPLIKTYVSSPLLSNQNLVSSNGVHRIAESDWNSLVIQSELPVMVTFTALWCGQCRQIIPILFELDSQYEDKFKFYTVDSDFEPSLAERCHITGLPTNIVFKGGNEMAKYIGANRERLGELVNEYI